MRGDRLRALREAANLTQEELANEIDSSEPQILRYEKNQSVPRADVLMRIAQYFNVSADFLLGLTDNPSVIFEDDLQPAEAAVIAAWRRGDFKEVMRKIAEAE